MPEQDAVHAAGPAVGRRHGVIAIFTIAMIAVHLVLRFAFDLDVASDAPYARPMNWPLFAALLLGGGPLVFELLLRLVRFEFGSDLLAGISIVTAAVLHEYLAGSIVVLMLSGGEALEAYAVRSASSVLDALARRMPSAAHRKVDSTVEDIPLHEVQVGDVVMIYPHETCPVDGTVVEGHGVMDESYLTGEPYLLSKSAGSAVLSGAINGETALTIRADRLAIDSRYAKIMEVMQQSAQRRPKLRRLGDRLGAVYTPVAVLIGIAAWVLAGDPVRFLAVMVVATPCPLLIAIPVAVIGSVSLAAKRAIIIRDPVVLERINSCSTMIFDKTGTLTYGEPKLIEQVIESGFDENSVLAMVASIERYSKHPLSDAIIKAGERAGVAMHQASEISERPGEGLRGVIAGREVQITSRKKLTAQNPGEAEKIPPQAGGLECVVMIDGRFAALYRFRDTPRREGASFITHLKPLHHVNRVLLVSGDRESEVKYLAEKVGIREVFANQSPEKKVEIVRAETKKANTVFVGDGINDAPALMAATVGIAFGQNSDVTIEAAGAVVMDSSLEKVDELMHIAQRMMRIALQSALGGMALSVVGMGFAAFGLLPPVAGALTQEAIDVIVVLNALRVAAPPKALSDF